ncbi:MAG: GIY-YIG nuclease family protein [Gemmatimonadetes bacterium]|nr:GIY-YIG nuclease family protein [Gemmatimonadota bacterium]MCC6769721.1 GIY-YIG nuclease family protein [Gemmatimonadaceae bacterium]
MSLIPKTIQIFLPGGDPRGIRVAEITTRIVQAIEIPRSLLSDFLKMPESSQVGVYFLFGQGEARDEPRVYVGQTGELRQRLSTHHQKKEFWDRAVVVISRTHSLTQTHALFLEWYCLQAARSAARYSDENGNAGSKPHTPAPLEADCLEIYDTAHTLLSTLGYPLFDPVVSPAARPEEREVFYCKASEADGRGLYTSDGFVVLQGSSGRKDVVPSFADTSHMAVRQSLLDSGVMEVMGDRVVFTKDHLFRSPSGAAIVLMGRSANGWVDWKNAAGQTLDSLKRQSVSE